MEGRLLYKEYPHPDDMSHLMNLWFSEFGTFDKDVQNFDVLTEMYAAMQLSFVSIHPFFDGNGRIARLISNFPLLKSGFPPITISKENRKQYLELLSSYQRSSESLNSKTKRLINQENPIYREFIRFCRNEYQQIQES